MGESSSSGIGAFFSGQKELIADFWLGRDAEGDASRLDKASGVAADFLEPMQNAGSSFVQKNDLEHKTSEALSVASGFWKPAMAEQKEVLDGYWKKDGQADHSVARGVTSHLSLILGRYQDWSLGRIGKLAEEDLEKYPTPISNLLSFLLFMDKESSDQGLVVSANAQLERIRYYTNNNIKEDYYKVVVKESENESIVNAITSSATVYPTTAALQVLEEDEVAAMLAHELGHASLNHNIPTLAQIFSKAGSYFGKLSLESMAWLFTGHEGRILDKVRREGLAFCLMDHLAKIDASKIEMEADTEGVRILMRAGISPENLKSALVKLTMASEGSDHVADAEDTEANDKVRKYPGLMERFENIDRVIAENTSNLVANNGGR